MCDKTTEWHSFCWSKHRRGGLTDAWWAQAREGNLLSNFGRGGYAMYLSRLTFHTQLGKTRAVEQELRQLTAMVSQVRGLRARVLRNHFASAGAADLVFEQEAADLAMLEA
jgi:hypothetical protein